MTTPSSNEWKQLVFLEGRYMFFQISHRRGRAFEVGTVAFLSTLTLEPKQKKRPEILFVGPKETCEMKANCVATDGELIEDVFDVSSVQDYIRETEPSPTSGTTEPSPVERECVLKFYEIPEHLREDVWRKIKDLNSRVRRL
ncbi:hypothetical protein OSTOST_08596 [Ostertagia ostertagi]